MLDNYQRATGREEEVTAEELREQDVFLREVMETELMKKLFAFLHTKSERGSRGRGRPRWGPIADPAAPSLCTQIVTAPRRNSCRI